MSMSVETDFALERSLELLEAKFMRLLELDRQSPEFEALFEEVDRQLGALAQEALPAAGLSPAGASRLRLAVLLTAATGSNIIRKNPSLSSSPVHTGDDEGHDGRRRDSESRGKVRARCPQAPAAITLRSRSPKGAGRSSRLGRFVPR